MVSKPCIKCGSVERNSQGNCKPCDSAHKANWYQKNKEKCKQRNADWVKAHPEKAKEHAAKWRANNREYAVKKGIEWAKNNPERSKEHIKSWRDRNPDWFLIGSQNRRARKRNAGGKLSVGLAGKLFKLQKGKCACGCKQPLGDDYHLDHIMPLALGGTNTDDNIQLLRSICNMQKHAKHPVDFMQSRGFLL